MTLCSPSSRCTPCPVPTPPCAPNPGVQSSCNHINPQIYPSTKPLPLTIQYITTAEIAGPTPPTQPQPTQTLPDVPPPDLHPTRHLRRDRPDKLHFNPSLPRHKADPSRPAPTLLLYNHRLITTQRLLVLRLSGASDKQGMGSHSRYSNARGCSLIGEIERKGVHGEPDAVQAAAGDDDGWRR